MLEQSFVFSEDERIGCLSLFSPHSFIINFRQYHSVEDFLFRIKRNPLVPARRLPEFQLNKAEIFSRHFRPARMIYWGRSKIPAGSRLHKKLIERAIRSKFTQNRECMSVLLETPYWEILYYMEDPRSGSDMLPPHELADILQKIREENLV